MPRTRAERREGEGRVYGGDDGSTLGAGGRGAPVVEIPHSGSEPNGVAESSESGADGSGRAAHREGILRKLFPMALNRSKSESAAIILASSSRDEGVEGPWIWEDVGNDGAQDTAGAVARVLDAFQNGEMLKLQPGGGTNDLDDHLTVSERGPSRYRAPYDTMVRTRQSRKALTFFSEGRGGPGQARPAGFTFAENSCAACVVR